MQPRVLISQPYVCNFFFKQPQLCTCNLGLCLYCNKVVQHATCENHTRACGKAVSQFDETILDFFLNSNSLGSLKFEEIIIFLIDRI
jgi:hypothetical protein